MAQRPDQFTLNASHPLATGLVFAGLGNKPGSVRYHDSSVYGNTGTLTNMDPATDWVWDSTSGRILKDFGSSGSTEKITLPSNASSFTGSFSFACWAVLTAVPNVSTSVVATCMESHVASYNNYWASLNAYNDTGTTKWEMALYNGTQNPRAIGPVVSLNALVHLAGVRDVVADEVQLYVNGTKYSTTDTTTSVPSYSALNIGKGTHGTQTRHFIGRIGDELIYSRAITLPEISAIADPSNVMLSGLLQPPRRNWWPVVSGVATTPIPVFMNQYRQRVA